jgi:hypothetical protein
MAASLAAVLGVALAAPSVAYACAAGVVALVTLAQWRSARAATGKRGLRAIERDGAGRWWLVPAEGRRVAARLEAAPFVTGPLIVLRFASGGRRQVLALWPDSAEPQALRRLRVALRIAPGGPQAVSSGGA